MSQRAQTRVIGIGNDLRQDDSVGLVVARRLKPYTNARVDVVEHPGEATSLLEAWAGIPRIVLVDAVRSDGLPGTILRVDVHRAGFQHDSDWRSSHFLGLAEAVTLARRLGRLPPSVLVFGIVGQQFGIGEDLSPSVGHAVPLLVERLKRELGLSVHALHLT